MTVPTKELTVEKYKGNGATNSFPFGFPVAGASGITVTVAENETDTTGAKVLENGHDYTVELNESSQGGKIILPEPLAAGKILAISRDTPVDQDLDLVNQGEFFSEDLESAYDKLTLICQELKERIKRTLVVPVTSDKAPEEVLSELLDVAAKAQEYADKAEETLREAQETARNVDAAWLSVQEAFSFIQEANRLIDEHLARSEEILDRVETIGEEVDTLAPHVDDLVVNAEHIDEIHRVGSDLRGTEAPALDLGHITDDTDTFTTVTEGYIKKVAEHIDDCIHPVGDSIDNVNEVAASLQEVTTVADDLKGLSVPSLDLGLVTDKTEDFNDYSGGFIQTVAGNIDEVAAVGGSIESVNIVAENIESVKDAVGVAQTLTETRDEVNRKAAEVAKNTEKAEQAAESATESRQQITTAIGDAEEAIEAAEGRIKKSETQATASMNAATAAAKDAQTAADSAHADAEALAGDAQLAKQAAEEAIEANKQAGFSFRYSDEAEPGATIDPATVEPNARIKAGDHVLGPDGELMAVSEVTEAGVKLTETVTSLKGLKGDKGETGDRGYWFTPSIDAQGVLHWTNNGGLPNPPDYGLTNEAKALLYEAEKKEAYAWLIGSLGSIEFRVASQLDGGFVFDSEAAYGAIAIDLEILAGKFAAVPGAVEGSFEAVAEKAYGSVSIVPLELTNHGAISLNPQTAFGKFGMSIRPSYGSVGFDSEAAYGSVYVEAVDGIDSRGTIAFEADWISSIGTIALRSGCAAIIPLSMTIH